ncbi:MAG: C10 family peptidase [Muribaculaceae bacterium]|nr:C10 family peptidase [Muribaculaceae bacterium]
MKKYILSIISLLCVFGLSYARKISLNEALAISQGFRSANLGYFSPDASSAAKFRDQIYVINGSNGGWMLVSADDRAPLMVLGYSDKGSLDLNNLSTAAQGVLEGYAEGLQRLDTSSAKTVAPSLSSRGSAAPLLGDIAWDQGYPYNALFPWFGEYQGNAGCVQIAQGQMMYFYQHPKKGQGSNSFVIEGVQYSADFSKSFYQWNIMKPYYDGDDSQESIDAVSKLIYDIAIANNANLSNALTPAALNEAGLIDYFKYDRSIYVIKADECTREYLENAMRQSIDEGHPVYIQAYNDMGGGHAFICDGYNDEGYFHFNMGGATGYYLSTATGYDRGQMMTMNFMPDEGGSPTIWAGSSQELYWTGGNNITCNIRAFNAFAPSGRTEVAIALEDPKSNVQYFIQYSNDNLNISMESLTFNDKVSDGDYILYPVYRVNGGEWMKVNFPDNAADHLILNVTNGVKTYTNTSTGGVIDPGTYLIDGVYYNLVNVSYEGEDYVARVTYRNNLYGSYSGDVVIPATVTIDDVEYPVTQIGASAFSRSDLGNVYVGPNVESIGNEAFFGANVGSIEYANPSNITYLDQRVFCNCNIDEVKIPSGVSSIYGQTVTGKVNTIVIPPSVNYMAVWAIVNEYNTIKDFFVFWTSEDELPNYDVDKNNGYTPLFGDFSKTTLHVPKGCADLYKNNELWGVFGKYVEDATTGIGSIESVDDEIGVSVSNGSIRFDQLPAGEIAQVYNLQGMLIGQGQVGTTVKLSKGVYIIRTSKKSIKVVI